MGEIKDEYTSPHIAQTRKITLIKSDSNQAIYEDTNDKQERKRERE